MHNLVAATPQKQFSISCDIVKFSSFFLFPQDFTKKRFFTPTKPKIDTIKLFSTSHVATFCPLTHSSCFRELFFFFPRKTKLIRV